MQKYLDHLPDITWAWTFGSNWDTVIVVAAGVVPAYIVYLIIKAIKKGP